MIKITKGSCNCGSISWQVEGDLRPITACHCTQCQKQTGLYYAATTCDKDALTINGETLKWYQSSPKAKRGFCSQCGSALFWVHEDEGHISILAGTIDGPTGLEISEHIFVADKGDFYEIHEDVPRFDAGS